MEKVIHYCWFGGKPLSKMAKKCIKSWKKFLPEYEIMQWNEKNFDVTICPFVSEAYKNEKWAFVSDYARLYALYNYGGIYFDTDMEVLKKIDYLTEKEFFIGYEANKKIAAGVIGVKEKHNKYIGKLIQYYNNLEGFNEEIIFKYAIPNILTNEFNKYEMKTINNIDIFDDSIFVYPEEFFYPINYNYSKKIYTDNTCMVHYYSASWVPRGEKIAAGVYRKFGEKNGKRILNIYYRIINVNKNIIYSIKARIDRIKAYINRHYKINNRVNEFEEQLKKVKSNYIAISHSNWLGVGNVARDNFKSNVYIKEIETEKEAIIIAEKIKEHHYNLIIFNGFALGWDLLAKEIRKNEPEITIKVLWHGSFSLLSEWYDFCAFKEIQNLYNSNVINQIGFVKKSLYEFYKEKGYNVCFFMNKIKISDFQKSAKKENKDNEKVKIGLYCSGGRWVKNFYNQVAAISLVKNAVLDCIPLTEDLNFFANCFDLEVTGKTKNIERNELLKRMANNDINVYTTFTECAPLIPLESLELGIPCITGANHHYFEGTELEKYLVVEKVDNIMEIYNKIELALENKDKIIELYDKLKIEYNKKATKSIEQFLLS